MPTALTPQCPAGAFPAIDSSTATVAISAAFAWNSHEYSRSERKRIGFFADAIRQRFTPPPSLGPLPVLAESPDAGWGGERTEHSAVGGKLVLVLKPNGRLRDMFWQVLPGSASFAAAVFIAARTADGAREFAALPRSGIRATDDTLVVQVRSTSDALLPDELPLMKVRAPRYVTSEPAVRTSESPLFYPMYSRDGMVENEGEMQVIVGSDGRADLGASQVTRVEVPTFLSLMKRTVGSSTYTPALSNGCRVPSVVIERFKLSVRR